MKVSGYCLVSLFLVLSLFFTACGSPQAPAPAPTPQGPAAQTPSAGAPQLSREQQLFEAAKKEKEVVVWAASWYEGPVEKAFEAKYPGVRMNVWSGSDNVESLIVEEYKAGRHSADVVVLGVYRMIRLKDEGILQEYSFPNAQDWPDQPKHNFWRNHQVSLRLPMYNTSLVSQADVPKTWEALADPKWRGKAIISTSGAEWPLLYAYILGDVTLGANGKPNVKWERSVDFWKKVVEITRPKVGGGFRGPLDMLVLGDVSIMLVASATTGLYNVQRGAPTEFAPMSNTIGALWALAIPKNPPHPNAAQLAVDFLTSDEGSVVYANTSPNPTMNPRAAKKAMPNLYFASKGVTWKPLPAEYQDDASTTTASDYWVKTIIGR